MSERTYTIKDFYSRLEFDSKLHLGNFESTRAWVIPALVEDMKEVDNEKLTPSQNFKDVWVCIPHVVLKELIAKILLEIVIEPDITVSWKESND